MKMHFGQKGAYTGIHFVMYLFDEISILGFMIMPAKDRPALEHRTLFIQDPASNFSGEAVRRRWTPMCTSCIHVIVYTYTLKSDNCTPYMALGYSLVVLNGWKDHHTSVSHCERISYRRMRRILK